MKRMLGKKDIKVSRCINNVFTSCNKHAPWLQHPG